MKKKILVLLTIVMMVFSAMSVTTYAADESDYYNLNASVFFENSDCVCIDDCDAEVVIKKAGEAIITVPVTHEQGSNMYTYSGDTDGIDAIIAEVGAAYDTAVDAVSDKYYTLHADADGNLSDDMIEAMNKEIAETQIAVLASYGYTFELVMDDKDAEHEMTATVDLVAVNTPNRYLQVMDANAEYLIVGVEEEFKAALEAKYPGTVVVEITDNGEDGKKVKVNGSDVTFMNVWEVYLDIFDPADEDGADSIAEIEALAEKQDRINSGEFNGDLFVQGGVTCECPFVAEVTVEHQYYEADGEVLSGWGESECFKVEIGSVYSIENLAVYPEYEGVKYEVEGVYVEDKKVTEFTIPEDGVFVIVKYVPAEEETTAPDEETTVPDDEDPVAPDEEETTTPDQEEQTETDESPETGDDFNLALYGTIMILAMVAMFLARRVKA